ncbi:expressed unknown protein [Seminavis robusta]|uniref:Uncharacterized protein n=1 Tax=Seminavis robusta TaxID=568900 RepID=A0A9N8D6Z1_9STRA|nr:expressed unknown protein [Seminavis robusta]|eukprot:Sro23_g015710.1 n/a (117) ;mRNA; r:56685-57035
MAKNKKSGKKSNKKQQQTQAPPAQPEMHQEALTNTNTDKTCLDTKKPFFFRYFYQYNLWTGLYMLNPSERAGFNFFGLLFTSCVIMYMYDFFNGFRDGFNQSAAMEGGAEEALMMS